MIQMAMGEHHRVHLPSQLAEGLLVGTLGLAAALVHSALQQQLFRPAAVAVHLDQVAGAGDFLHRALEGQCRRGVALLGLLALLVWLLLAAYWIDRSDARQTREVPTARRHCRRRCYGNRAKH